MSQPSILIVSQDIPSGLVGGAERQMALLGKLLASNGWRVHYAAPAKSSDPNVIRLSPNPHAVRSLPSDARRLAETSYDLYYLRGLMTRAAALRWAARSIRRVNPNAKFIYAAANEQEQQWGLYRQWVREMKTPAHLRPFAYARAVLREALMKWGEAVFDVRWVSKESQIAVRTRPGLPPPVHIPFLAEFPQETPPYPDGPLRVFWAGSMRWNKAPERFLELAEASKKNPTTKSIQFVMAGPIVENRYRGLIEKSSTEGVIEYLGPLDRAGMEKAIAGAHLLAKTNPIEAMPNNTLVEGWGAGRPVLAWTDLEDPSLESSGLGWTTQTMDGMVDQLRTLASNPAVLARFGERSRAYAMERHSLEAAGPRVLSALESLGFSV